MANNSKVRIRSYRSSTDEAAVKRVFADGMYGMEYAGCLLILNALGPKVAVAGVISSGIAYYNGWRTRSVVLAGVVPFVSAMLLARSVLVSGIRGYVTRSLQDDLENIDTFYLDNGPSHFWVAVEDATDEVIGCVALEHKSDGWGELRRMSVAESGRRRGVASKLHGALLEHAKRHKMKGIFLETSNMQSPAIALYKRLGYEHESSSTKEAVPSLLKPLLQIHLFRMTL